MYVGAFSDDGNLLLFTGSSSAILIQAKEKAGSEAILEIKVLPQAVKDGKVNCTDYLQVPVETYL